MKLPWEKRNPNTELLYLSSKGVIKMKRVLPLVITSIAAFLLFSFVMGVPGKASDEEEINKLIQTAKTPRII